MMHVTRFLSFLLLVVVSSASAATVELPTIIMQLRSTVDTDNSELLSVLLDTTTSFLDSYFSAYYVNSQPADYFSHTAQSINSFGIQGLDGSYITTVQLDGMLFFTVEEPMPTQEFVATLLANAFQHLNQELYIESLMGSPNEFLNDLTHIIIEVDEETVAAQDNVAGDKEEEEDEEDNGNAFPSDWLDSKWLRMTIYGTAGLAGAILMVVCVCLCRCCFCRKRGANEDGTFPDGVAEIPHLSGTSRDLFKSKEARTEKNGGIGIKTSLTPQSTTSSKETGIYTSKSPPSPVHSVVSQDSSKFTYNPQPHQALYTSKSNLSLTSLSNIHIDMPSMDLENWQRTDVISPITPAPFGNDISAIEQGDKDKGDMSLLEEMDGLAGFGVSAVGRGGRRSHNSTNIASREKYYRTASSAKEVRPWRSSRPSAGSSPHQSSLPRQYQVQPPAQPYRGHSYLDRSHRSRDAPSQLQDTRDESNDVSTEESSLGVASISDSSSDVINDLRNLSRQIDRHRRGRY
jgi:hypothetical protein